MDKHETGFHRKGNIWVLLLNLKGYFKMRRRVEGREVHCKGKGLCLAISHLPGARSQQPHLYPTAVTYIKNQGAIPGLCAGTVQPQSFDFPHNHRVTKALLIHLHHMKYCIIAALGREGSYLDTGPICALCPPCAAAPAQLRLLGRFVISTACHTDRSTCSHL